MATHDSIKPNRLEDVLKGTFSVEQLHEIAAKLVSKLRYQAAFMELDLREYEKALAVIASLPLTPAVFGKAKLELVNALRYCQCGEWEVARYELRMLENSLKC